MRSKTIFRGAATALITPLTAGIDYDAFRRVIEYQIADGSARRELRNPPARLHLSDEEHRGSKFAAEVARGASPSSPARQQRHGLRVRLTKFHCDSATTPTSSLRLLQQGTQKGITRCTTRTRDASTKPLNVYNVPSRPA
jgi:hypothetical protein